MLKRKLENTSVRENAEDDEIAPKEKKTSAYFVSSGPRLVQSDYNKPCVDLAKFLLGKMLCRQCPDTGLVIRAKIVEVESYPGPSDGASHSYKGQTRRNGAMFMSPGTSYVYSIYGMYYCFNVSSLETGGAVLIRALEPMDNVELMRSNREKKRKNGGKISKDKDICNGPSKLCQAFSISKEQNCVDLCVSDCIWMEDFETVCDDKMVNTTRIGIEGCGKPWSQLKLRWYVLGNTCVSVRDKFAESVLIKPI